MAVDRIFGRVYV